MLTNQEILSDHAVNSPFLIPHISHRSGGEKLTNQDNSSKVFLTGQSLMLITVGVQKTLKLFIVCQSQTYNHKNSGSINVWVAGRNFEP